MSLSLTLALVGHFLCPWPLPAPARQKSNAYFINTSEVLKKQPKKWKQDTQVLEAWAHCCALLPGKETKLFFSVHPKQKQNKKQTGYSAIISTQYPQFF